MANENKLTWIGFFFMAVMTIGMAVGTRRIDPGSYIIEYLVVIAAAILVAVIGGFAVVRPVPHGDRRGASDLVSHAQKLGAELCASPAGTCRSQAREGSAGEEGPRPESSATTSEQEKE